MTLELDLQLSREDFALDVRAELPGTGVTVLFGPSGSGKTTVLRCVAGLEPEVRGRVVVRGKTWMDREAGLSLPTHQRGVGYVFQEAALFPHLSVRGNLEFGWSRTPAGTARPPFDEVLELLGVGPLLDRPVPGLSGGERQRVAMARAVLAGPEVLLLDEPLASLDRASRDRIVPYLQRLREHLEVPLLYVTHDPVEGRRLADRVLLLERGERVALGGPELLEEGTHAP